MDNLQNYTRYTGDVNPVDNLIDTANLHPSDVMTEEEIEQEEKVEAGDLEELLDLEQPEVTGVVMDESRKFIIRYKNFKS